MCSFIVRENAILKYIDNWYPIRDDMRNLRLVGWLLYAMVMSGRSDSLTTLFLVGLDPIRGWPLHIHVLSTFSVPFFHFGIFPLLRW